MYGSQCRNGSQRYGFRVIKKIVVNFVSVKHLYNKALFDRFCKQKPRSAQQQKISVYHHQGILLFAKAIKQHFKDLTLLKQNLQTFFR